MYNTIHRYLVFLFVFRDHYTLKRKTDYNTQQLNFTRSERITQLLITYASDLGMMSVDENIILRSKTARIIHFPFSVTKISDIQISFNNILLSLLKLKKIKSIDPQMSRNFQKQIKITRTECCHKLYILSKHVMKWPLLLSGATY